MGRPRIVDRIAQVHRRYGGTIVVESVAAQAFISHFLREMGSLPVIDFKTGKGKMSLEWQVESLGAEMARGQRVIPSDDGKVNHPEVDAFLRDCLYYSPDKHTPDRLAAACFARWGAEQAEQRVEFGHLDLLMR